MDYLHLTQEELTKRIWRHEKWLRGENGGYCLSLMGMKLALLDFSGHDLSHANLSGSELSHCSFEDCKLLNVNFVGCNLLGADFRGANLSGATLAFADCRQAVFLNVNLEGTFLRDVIGFRHTVTSPRESVPNVPRRIARVPRKKKPESLLTKVMKSAKLWV